MSSCEFDDDLARIDLEAVLGFLGSEALTTGDLWSAVGDMAAPGASVGGATPVGLP